MTAAPRSGGFYKYPFPVSDRNIRHSRAPYGAGIGRVVAASIAMPGAAVTHEILFSKPNPALTYSKTCRIFHPAINGVLTCQVKNTILVDT